MFRTGLIVSICGSVAVACPDRTHAQNIQPGDRPGPPPVEASTAAGNLEKLLARLLNQHFIFDLNAYEGLPADWLVADLSRFEQLASAGDLSNHLPVSDYNLLNSPFVSRFVPGRDVPPGSETFALKVLASGPHEHLAEVTLVPSLSRVVEWLSQPPAQRAQGCSPSWDAPTSDWIGPWTHYAIGLYFDPTPSTGRPTSPLFPLAKGATFLPMTRGFPLESFGRLIGTVEDFHRNDFIAELGLGGPGGRIVRRVLVVRLNSRLWMRETWLPDGTTTRELVIPFMDANGGVREDVRAAEGVGHCMDNRLRWNIEGVPIASREQARTPWPFDWTRASSSGMHEGAAEQFVFDAGAISAAHGLLIVRADEGWKPFIENVVVDCEPKFDHANHNEVRRIVLSADASDQTVKDLIRAMARAANDGR